MNATVARRNPWDLPAGSTRLEALKLLVQKMRELVAAGKFEPAFALGDRIMATRPPAEIVEAIMYPVDRGLTTFPDSGLYDLLQAALKHSARSRFRPWYDLLITVLLDRLRWSSEALRESEKLMALPRRYGWMRWHRGLMLLNNHWDKGAAAAEFQAVLESMPQVWKAHALLAELALARGERDRALRTMNELLSTVPESDRTSVLGWRGEMRLWIGEYREALPDLDQAVARQSPLALCWRGAAHVKLGDFPAALRDLDSQLRSHPEDQEALVWRGEARRLMGRWREALTDLDAACRFGNSPLWAYINRALTRSRLRDIPGLWSDYLLVPEWVRSYFSWKLGADVKPDTPPRVITAQLEAILVAARGIRRNDQYLYSLWLKPLIDARRGRRPRKGR
jgi:tetratricopeptide (TPR) repeat protein